MSKATLYTLPGSHPGVATALMLDYKGIEYDRVDLMPVISKAALRALGFPGITVPAIRFGGRKVQGSVAIARALDEVCPGTGPAAGGRRASGTVWKRSASVKRFSSTGSARSSCGCSVRTATRGTATQRT